jgi:hypothetical protein
MNAPNDSKMSLTFSLANNIYRALKPHEESVKHIEALFLWNRPIFSALLLLVIELLFVFTYLLPFRKSCIFALVTGCSISLYTLLKASPGLLSVLFSFNINPVPEYASNHIRGLREIAAFLTTALSIWTKLLGWAFTSVSAGSEINTVFLTITSLGFFAFVSYLIGDFVFLWTYFHLVFVLPGVLFLPSVENWLFNATDATPRGSVVDEAAGERWSEANRPSAVEDAPAKSEAEEPAKRAEPDDSDKQNPFD